MLTHFGERLKRDIKLKDVNVNFSIHDVDPKSIAVDWIGNNIYWIDASLSRPSIMMSDLRAKSVKKIMTQNLQMPQCIVLDPEYGYAPLFFKLSPALQTSLSYRESESSSKR